MAACVDIDIEIHEVSKTDSNNSRHHSVAYSENKQNDLPEKSFFRLDSKWDKRKALSYSFEKVLPSTQTSKWSITDECV